MDATYPHSIRIEPTEIRSGSIRIDFGCCVDKCRYIRVDSPAPRLHGLLNPDWTLSACKRSGLITLGAHAQRGYCSCPVCMYVLIPAASHIGITKERYQRILRNAGIVLNFADFPKNASFKSYSVICLPRAAPAS